MKKIYLFLPVIIATLLFSFFGVSDVSYDKEDAKRKYTYKPLINSNKQFTANEAIEFKNMLYKDAVTGKIKHQKLADARTQVKQMMLAKSSNLSFIEEGPDNIGGRTRGIAIHPDNDSVMFAGSVSGGLFVTRNKGNTWQRVQEFDDAMENSATGTGSLGISSITITPGGALYVATGGSAYEGTFSGEYSANITGDGVWFSMSTNSFNFQQLSGTNNKDVLKVISDPTVDNKIYFVGVSMGLNVSSDYQASQSVSGLSQNATIGDVKISSDGQHVVAGVSQGGIRT